MLPTPEPVVLVFLGAFLIVKASRPMLMIFAAAMATPTADGIIIDPGRCAGDYFPYEALHEKAI